MKKTFPVVLCAIVILACFGRALAVDTKDTKFLTQPAVSASQVAFVYANDLWTAGPRRQERPAPDVGHRRRIQPGLLAGRVPHRLQRPVRREHGRLRHPGRRGHPQAADLAPGRRRRPGLHARRESPSSSCRPGIQPCAPMRALYSVPVEGGFPVKLPIPYAYSGRSTPRTGNPSPTTRFSDAFLQWKNYRGGTHFADLDLQHGRPVHRKGPPAGRPVE